MNLIKRVSAINSDITSMPNEFHNCFGQVHCHEYEHDIEIDLEMFLQEKNHLPWKLDD